MHRWQCMVCDCIRTPDMYVLPCVMCDGSGENSIIIVGGANQSSWEITTQVRSHLR
jgi:hypothetical protein